MSRRSAFSLNSETGVQVKPHHRPSLSSGCAHLLAIAAGCLLFAAVPNPAWAGSVADALSEEVRCVFKRCKNAVVKIEASDKNGRLCGTGFFIAPNGTLLTSYSVGGDSFDMVVSYGEMKYPARRLTADFRSGIAILQVEKADAATPFLPIGKSKDLSIATPVIMIAYPMDMPIAPNFGMIAGFDLKYLNRYFATTHIRANVAVKRGEGGAPLLNMQGEVIGVVISGLDGGSSCFALPIEAAEKIHRDYVRFGAPRPGWLGLAVNTARNPGPNGSTAEVHHVEEDGPALKAGIEQGDIILKIGESSIQAPEDVLNATFYLTAGENVPVTIQRGEKEVTLDLDPIERASAGKGRPKQLAAPIGSEDITLRPER